MTKTGALKKGMPPARIGKPNVIAKDPRAKETKNKPLQIMLPPEIFEAFSAQAGQEFGYRKGAKKELFLAMWEAYRNR